MFVIVIQPVASRSRDENTSSAILRSAVFHVVKTSMYEGLEFGVIITSIKTSNPLLVTNEFGPLCVEMSLLARTNMQDTSVS